jgi:DNA-binding transcriptional MerR regulator
MGRPGLLTGEVAARSGLGRKALRLYEASGILPPPARTASGYRVYPADTLALLAFVARARRLGFSLAEIRDIVAIRRAGRPPCAHVRALARRKAAEVERALADLSGVRRQLRALLAARPARATGRAAVCPHIERPR